MKLTKNIENIKEILENHAKWLGGKDDGVQADLRGANLCGADLSGANLRGADLRDANLRGANLRGANLRGAELRYANLRYAYLGSADLCGVDLCGADLRDTELHYVNLRSANLRSVDLCGADLRDAELRDAYFGGADLRGAKNIPFIPYWCPEFGSFIGYKKVGDYIIELEISADAKRCSATTRKCRCNKAKVLSIQSIDGTVADIKVVSSNYDKEFIYKVGAIVEDRNFDDDRWNEWSTGIHFYINRQDAVEYDF